MYVDIYIVFFLRGTIGEYGVSWVFSHTADSDYITTFPEKNTGDKNA